MSTVTTLVLDSLSEGNGNEFVSKGDGDDDPRRRHHQVQYIPANIDVNGPEEIDTYFNAFTRQNKEKNCLENSLRGYPLEGEVRIIQLIKLCP